MNKQVVIVGFIIVGGGVLNMWLGTGTSKTTITRIVLGAFVLVLVLSILDLFGGPISTLANALAMLAAVFVILTTYVPLLQKLASIVGGGSSKIASTSF